MISFDIINDTPTTNKTIFLLTDLDVPMDEYGKILNDEKIQIAMPTIKYLIKTGARIVIATHIGNPTHAADTRFSAKPIAKYLDKRLFCEVNFCPVCIGQQAKHDIFRTEYGNIIVLENLLFYKEERDCDINFARQLADGMNIYVNDAFGYSSQNYASVLGVPLFVRATGGFALEHDIKQLDAFLNTKNHFTSAIIGGKMTNKIDLLYYLIERCKFIAVGGIVANNFLKAFGYNIGKSQFEPQYTNEAVKIFKTARKHDCLLTTPIDVITTKSITNDTKCLKNANELDDDDIIIDLGTETSQAICDVLDISKCVFYHGNIGINEIHNNNASSTIAKKITQLTKNKRIFSIANGKDTILSLRNNNCLNGFSFIPQSSEAVLQYMSGKILPGLEILKRLSKELN